MKKNKLIRVMTALCCEPWLLTPVMHRTLTDIVSAHAAGGDLELAQHAMAMQMDSKPNREYVVDEGCAIFDIEGVIGRKFDDQMRSSGVVSVDVFTRLLNEARESSDVESAMLVFDSPGGVARGIPEAAEAIRAFDAVKPIRSYVDGMCCSAAYWLASQTDHITATPSSDVGSVGVYCAVLDQSRAYEMEGYKVEVFKSGKFKGMGLPGTALTDPQREILQASVDKIGVDFRHAVREGRNTSEKKIMDEIMQGQSFDAAEAMANGLIDGIEDFGSAMRALCGETKKKSARR